MFFTLLIVSTFCSMLRLLFHFARCSVLNSLNIFFGPSKKKFILVTYTKLDKHILHCLNLVCQPPGATGSDAFDALPPKFEGIFDQVADFFQLMDFL